MLTRAPAAPPHSGTSQQQSPQGPRPVGKPRLPGHSGPSRPALSFLWAIQNQPSLPHGLQAQREQTWPALPPPSVMPAGPAPGARGLAFPSPPHPEDAGDQADLCERVLAGTGAPHARAQRGPGQNRAIALPGQSCAPPHARGSPALSTQSYFHFLAPRPRETHTLPKVTQQFSKWGEPRPDIPE